MDCTVWWVALGAADPGRWVLPHEVERAGRYRRPDDRARSVLGSVMLRLAAGAVLGRDPARVEVERTCPRHGTSTAPDAHGRPAVSGEAGVSLSLSHSGDLVIVAVARGAEVGVDVEQVRPLPAELLAEIAAPGEPRATDLTAEEATRVWVRKESVLKATGEGLSVEPARVRLTGARSPRECVRLGSDGQPERSGLTWDLDGAPGPEPVPTGDHCAALTLLAPSLDEVGLVVRSGFPDLC